MSIQLIEIYTATLSILIGTIVRKFHRYLGLLMLLPFLGWAVTGVFFFVKPGYQSAYEPLNIKSYPLGKLPELPESNDWQQVRWIRSILGLHLLVEQDGKWQQLDPDTLEPRSMPDEASLLQMVNDAISANPDRYGNAKTVSEQKVLTDTNINISIDWHQMRLRQKGDDTKFINTMYKVHYLQWTGIKFVDRVLGVVGLGLVVILGMLGLVMTLRSRKA
ncbi:PepSY domain-containing protein [Pleionea sp. CnH1-48]|uniref:PepSY domain-containing protein n=1 Tax=Pleionea sp. CnH1-48 TaxID=2954494 RepID=UPI002097C370|nr:PepSY domain-containing protein [Pleionea sp. CnH1-48]MCO7224491.1 PepSY domain-containing protein [Pleionea sp. CnH1-48]